ncbi:MAG: STAS domain-containing protein, partial [Azonexus sp.]
MISSAPSLKLHHEAGTVTCRITGDWHAGHPLPGPLPAMDDGKRLLFDCAGLGRWDSSLLARLLPLAESARQAGCAINDDGLPPGLARLLRLALAVPARRQAASEDEENIFDHVGNVTLATWRRIPQNLGFLGDLF